MVTMGGGAYAANDPVLSSSLWVVTMSPNAQNVYSYYSNVTTNVNCLPLSANLSFISDQNSSVAISSGSCPSGTSSVGSQKNGFTVCNPTNIFSNAVVLSAFNRWSTCQTT
jgi:hypothetical protein